MPVFLVARVALFARFAFAWCIPRVPRAGLHLALTMFVVASVARPAFAEYREAHSVSNDVRLTVDASGSATVVHNLRYNVVAGRFEGFDVAGIDPRARLAPSSVARDDSGAEVPVVIERAGKTPDNVHLSFAAPKGIGRGTYDVLLTYELDLAAAGFVVPDGDMWRMGFVAPPAREGAEGARVVFDLPAGATAPALAATDDAMTTLTTLERRPGRDILALARAHVPRGATVTWSVRVDPNAFPGVTSAELRPEPHAAVPESSSHLTAALAALCLCALAGALAAALRAKNAHLATLDGEARAVPLVAVPFGLGPFAYGAVGAAGFACLLFSNTTLGGALVAIAMALGTHRSPRTLPAARGPGRWRVIDDEVLRTASRQGSRGGPFDLGGRRGRLTAIACAFILAAVTFVMSRTWPGAVIAAPLAATLLLPLFLTGGSLAGRRGPFNLGAQSLVAVHDRVRQAKNAGDLRWLARFVEGTADFDEVRLACAPKAALPGLRTIELAIARAHPAPRPARYEVFVRYEDGAAAAAKIAKIAPKRPVVVGRTENERVLGLTPVDSDPCSVATLLGQLVKELEARRASDRPAAERRRRRRFASEVRLPWTGPERRAGALPVTFASSVAERP